MQPSKLAFTETPSGTGAEPFPRLHAKQSTLFMSKPLPAGIRRSN
jgi:hypothetical protein